MAEKGIVAAVRRGLAGNGLVEGRDFAIDFRFSGGDYGKLASMARDLVGRDVKVIITSGLPATLAAKKATTTIPIVFRLAIDPVAFGLATTLSRPGGNLTGVTMLFDPLTAKKLELLHELAPASTSIAVLINPENQNAASHRQHAEAAARKLGLALTMLQASARAELDPALRAAATAKVGSILVADDPFFDVSGRELTEGAQRYALPTMYYVRDFVDAGGLISYGPNFDEMANQVGDNAGRILKGAKPGELPIGQPTRFELVINLKAARMLHLTVPPSLLARADELIE